MFENFQDVIFKFTNKLSQDSFIYIPSKNNPITTPNYGVSPTKSLAKKLPIKFLFLSLNFCLLPTWMLLLGLGVVGVLFLCCYKASSPYVSILRFVLWIQEEFYYYYT